MKWVLAEADSAITDRLSKEAGIHPLIARLMVNRGITDTSSARAFLVNDISGLSDPGVFTGMEKALGRIKSALAAREKIVVYGDYDVDGVTAAALLHLVLRGQGAEVTSYIPDRMTEGYGLNAVALRKIKASGASLVITVDCGISAVNEAVVARSLGLDLIITDHHEAATLRRNGSDDMGDSGPAPLPEAYALVHPSLIFSNTSDMIRDGASALTGVGVAFKLAQAILGAGPSDEQLLSYLDLVTLGTVADMGRLCGENRALVKQGLEMLSADERELRPGIAALKEVAGLNGRRINAGTVGFSLAPRINASGRLEKADMAFRLLTTESREEAAMLAEALDGVNRERQAVEESIWEEARRTCRTMDLDSAGAIVLASSGWHPGVIGIVASRIAEEFYRPTVLISLQSGIGKGSARSIPGFDLYHGLMECSDLLLGFGGHTYAAGLSVAEDRIALLRERLGRMALDRFGAGGFVRTLSVDSAVAMEDLTFDLMRDLERLAPFGQGNAEPRLGARRLEVIAPRVVGNNHLKFQIRQENGSPFHAIAFNKGNLLGKLVRDGSRLAAVFTPRLNTWNGNTNIELDVKDVKIDNQ